MIKITDEAFGVLEQNKAEGYSFKRLASEAIIEKYGHAVKRGVPSSWTGGVPAGPDGSALAREFLKGGKTPLAALRELYREMPHATEFREKVADQLMAMAGEGV
jgi:hypothetical protein